MPLPETCYSCLALMGDILKREGKEGARSGHTLIVFRCFRIMRDADYAASKLGEFRVAGTSLDEKHLPRPEDYPPACEMHSGLRDVYVYVEPVGTEDGVGDEGPVGADDGEDAEEDDDE